MKISCESIDNGISLKVDDKEFSLEFADGAWEKYPSGMKKMFVDNYAFLKALHLPQMLSNGNSLDFNTSYPMFEKELFSCMLNSIPFCADTDGIPATENVKNFLNLKFNFKDFRTAVPDYDRKLEEKGVLSMSFGKDSLLTYGLAEELGLDPTLLYTQENDAMREVNYKQDIANRFSKEFRKEIFMIKNNTALMHRYNYWNTPKTEWGYGHLITEYWFYALPFLHSTKSKYVLFGNEKSCDDTYMSKDGYTCFPVFDQSSDWLVELTKMSRMLTNNQAEVVSLIEPIYEIAITKILHNRYPEVGKYQMSCFPDENDFGKEHYWCEHCSKCARIFIFMKANGLDPKRIGFRNDMLKLEHKGLYSLFGVEKAGTCMGYDAAGCNRDEQLLAFYKAYKNGAKGELIDLFRKELLDEAKEREDELHKKFYGIHPSKTVPQKLLKPLLSIYREELE